MKRSEMIERIRRILEVTPFLYYNKNGEAIVNREQIAHVVLEEVERKGMIPPSKKDDMPGYSNWEKE